MRWSVRSFYRRIYVPTYLVARDAAPETIESYGYSVKLWCELVGDTTFKRLEDRLESDVLIGQWISVLRERPGLNEDKVSAHTVNRHLRHIRAVFNRAYRIGLIVSKLNVELIRAPHKQPRVISDRDINAIYRACKVATWPLSVRPSDWWRCLIVLAWNTGLRKRTLLSLDRSSVLIATNELFIPYNITKNRSEQLLPTNECSQRHIRRVLRQHDDQRVLPWPHCRRIFYEQWHNIQYAAGISHPHFKIHDIRRTCATEVARSHGAGAAQAMLGHSSVLTTSKFYINWTELLRSVVDRIPQPRAFRA